jgi:hypothetical protein
MTYKIFPDCIGDMGCMAIHALNFDECGTKYSVNLQALKAVFYSDSGGKMKGGVGGCTPSDLSCLLTGIIGGLLRFWRRKFPLTGLDKILA